MATSALACIAAFGQPFRAFLYSIGLALLETVTYRLLMDSSLAFAIALAIFVLLTIFLTRPRSNLALIPANTWIKSFRIAPNSFRFQMAWMAGIPVILWLIWSPLGRADSRLVIVTSVLTLSIISYLSTRCCGISTAAFPGFGACLVYVVVHSGDKLLWHQSVLLFVGLLICFMLYLFFVRYSSHRVALVTDLALILAIHDILSLSSISGPDTAMLFANPQGVARSLASSLTPMLVMIFVLLAISYLIHTTSTGRVVAHSISDPFLARQHGLHPMFYLLVLGLVCIFASYLVQQQRCSYIGSISANIADPQLGIACLLIGYVMASDNPLKGYLLGLFLYIIPPDLLPKLGFNNLGEYTRLLILFPIVFAIYRGPDSGTQRDLK